MVKKTIIAIVALLVLGACENPGLVNPVPNYPVSMELNILGEFPTFTQSNIGAHMEFLTPRFPTERVGYSGVLVFVNFNEQYSAFDLCCPHCVQRYQPLEVNGIFAVCPVCGEEYDLSYGYGVPTKGIAENYLKTYKTNYNSATGKLVIYN
ncbi:MAG: hypothetical protein J5635_06115 [Paludibacteraceae bacterium]|nr:hypothetical protein [Paludibacteraceae bacterium]